MSDSQFQYTSNQNQFKITTMEGKHYLLIKKIFVVLSRILARENTVFCMALDRIIHEPPVITIYFPWFYYPVQRYNIRKQIMMQTI